MLALSDRIGRFRSLDIAACAQSIRQWWRQPYAFDPSWRSALLMGATLGALLAFIIIFLEPSGTDRYQAPWRNLRLSGYGLCVLLPWLLVHGVNRWRHRQAAGQWSVAREIQSLLILLPLFLLSAYFYNVYVVNDRQPAWDDALAWMLHIGLPYLPLLLLPGVLLRRLLHARLLYRSTQAGTITVRGHNSKERLRLAASVFVCAQAQQNYVTLYYLQGEELKQQMFRLTLAELKQQIPASQRVHRSWLVNPLHILAIQGNARQRQLRLRHVQQVIPVSAKFNLDMLTQDDALISPAAVTS